MARTEGTDLGRRNLLRGRLSDLRDARLLRPPWAPEQSVAEKCTGCGDCVGACPEAILTADPDGHPYVVFSDSACTFCGRCAEACEADVFTLLPEDPNQRAATGFSHVVRIEASCLMRAGVECRLCADHCDTQALRFDYRIRPAGGITLDAGACTGCGACIAPCPAGAIAIEAATAQPAMSMEAAS
ncbi:ferredoxin-type protein [Pseudoruegeria aquimaris]|uniref:Ferredoxin-type protein n=1 Tax=Pseudoruegeria aquimaris TaxID=393663 RepID=A0A1Y5SBA6_9RHOB|nr:ferredoxin-type protein NapF [Pseudoruegeria aquimaris]SLN36712.1 ferredoxin-type protein [Pseudoruegeria aquimaris]